MYMVGTIIELIYSTENESIEIEKVKREVMLLHKLSYEIIE